MDPRERGERCCCVCFHVSYVSFWIAFSADHTAKTHIVNTAAVSGSLSARILTTSFPKPLTPPPPPSVLIYLGFIRLSISSLHLRHSEDQYRLPAARPHTSCSPSAGCHGSILYAILLRFWKCSPPRTTTSIKSTKNLIINHRTWPHLFEPN